MTDDNKSVLCGPRGACTDGGEESLSRFLDNDLPSREAADTALHLQTCPSCQAVYQQMKRARTALRGLPSPGAPYGGPPAARVRVFERVRRSFRIADAEKIAPRKTARFPFWAGAAAAAATVCICGGVALFSPNAAAPLGDTVSPTKRVAAVLPAPTATPRVPLPSQNEMAFLYHLHDAHSASLSASDPTDRRDCAAEAQAALLRDSERLADTGAF